MTAHVSSSQALFQQFRSERPQPERCLDVQEVERLPGVHTGDTITCANGVLWVTQEGDSDDYLLQPGEKFVAHRSGIVLVQAFETSACRFFS